MQRVAAGRIGSDCQRNAREPVGGWRMPWGAAHGGGARQWSPEAAQEAVYHGADSVYVADAPALGHYETLPYSAVMAQIAEQTTPNILLIGMGDTGGNWDHVWPFACARV